MISGDLLFINLDDDEEYEIIEDDDVEEDFIANDECFLCGGDHYASLHC